MQHGLAALPTDEVTAFLIACPGAARRAAIVLRLDRRGELKRPLHVDAAQSAITHPAGVRAQMSVEKSMPNANATIARRRTTSLSAGRDTA